MCSFADLRGILTGDDPVAIDPSIQMEKFVRTYLQEIINLISMPQNFQLYIL